MKLGKTPMESIEMLKQVCEHEALKNACVWLAKNVSRRAGTETLKMMQGLEGLQQA